MSGRRAHAGARRTPRPTWLHPARLPPLPAGSPRHGSSGAQRRGAPRGHAETSPSPLLTLGQRVQHPRLLQVPPELLALRVGGLRRHGGSAAEKPGAGAGRRRWESGTPRLRLATSGPPNRRARGPPLPPGAVQRPATARTPPATPRPPHFVMGHSDSGSGVAGAGDRGWRALSGTAHARKAARACALASHGPGGPGCGLFSWRPGRSGCPIVGRAEGGCVHPPIWLSEPHLSFLFRSLRRFVCSARGEVSVHSRHVSRWGQRWAWRPGAGPAEPRSAVATVPGKEVPAPALGEPFSAGTSEVLVTYVCWLLGCHPEKVPRLP